ncbi:MAG: YbaB/EbfC family nucleoid-associated protein [Victivallaceae bacterium]|nr:YbaB/EbfC family nucleoid-associated protein [Victivallaceae bacterium]
MFENLAAMASAIKQAKEIKNNVKRIREDMANSSFEGFANDNKTKATVSGDLRVISIAISPDAGSAAGELAAAAVNAAMDNAKSTLQQRIREAAGGLDLPDLF